MSYRYVAFLRGINVGGHHKVPMADLRKHLQALGFENIITILNSGNIIFSSDSDNTDELEHATSEFLKQTFGFPIPTMIRKADDIQQLFNSSPFEQIEITKDIRLYISLLKADVDHDLSIPWVSSDHSFRILEERERLIISVLDLSVSKTTKAMEMLEKTFGKSTTTRNWKTIERIVNKL